MSSSYYISTQKSFCFSVFIEANWIEKWMSSWPHFVSSFVTKDIRNYEIFNFIPPSSFITVHVASLAQIAAEKRRELNWCICKVIKTILWTPQNSFPNLIRNSRVSSLQFHILNLRRRYQDGQFEHKIRPTTAATSVQAHKNVKWKKRNSSKQT